MSESVSRRSFLKAAILAPLIPSLLAACRRSDNKRVVNFFNWSNYIGKDTLPEFTKRTGVDVRYDMFADEDEMFTKIRAGARGYDLIVVGDYLIPRFKSLNLIEPVPPGALKNLDNLARRFRRPEYDPDEITVPYLWGTTGIAYNRKKLKKPPTSWWDLWDEKFKDRVSMLDNVRDCISVAMQLLNIPQTTRDPEDFRKIRELLVKQKPLVKQYSSSSYLNSLVAGEIDLAMTWSGDLFQTARENPDLDYVLPKEGTYMWVDCLAIMRGARHREDTLRLVDYLLEPAVAAGIANSVRYATPNQAATPLVDKALRSDPRVYPSPAVMKQLQLHHVLDSEQSELWSQTWADVKVA
ncbi:MAG: spermidine/putrescine ABC transporter substrate-binding protein [Elusimicrobia bacterium]|nr:spermidine/putrescine ABC transporter substrate-binding protein [Elusimicrobiota bacterium]